MMLQPQRPALGSEREFTNVGRVCSKRTVVVEAAAYELVGGKSSALEDLGTCCVEAAAIEVVCGIEAALDSCDSSCIDIVALGVVDKSSDRLGDEAVRSIDVVAAEVISEGLDTPKELDNINVCSLDVDEAIEYASD